MMRKLRIIFVLTLVFALSALVSTALFHLLLRGQLISPTLLLFLDIVIILLIAIPIFGVIYHLNKNGSLIKKERILGLIALIPIVGIVYLISLFFHSNWVTVLLVSFILVVGNLYVMLK